jgi:oligoribonuclease
MAQKKDHNDDQHENLCWLDLETTGLRTNEDAILEVGTVITDRSLDLDIIAELSFVVFPTKYTLVSEIDDYVVQMHTKSGLWEESVGMGQECVYFETACAEIVKFMTRHKAIGSPLCGSTINFDRAFLQAQAPELLKAFHYRNVDVSTLKNVFRLHFPHLPPFVPEGEANHRVIDDLHNSIAEYRHYINDINDGARWRGRTP